MCRSAPERTELFPIIPENVPPFCHSDRSEAEWRNPPRWAMNQHKIKPATWEDSSTRIRSLGMTCRGAIPFIRTGCIRSASGTARRPFPTVSLIGVLYNRSNSKDGQCSASHCRNSGRKGKQTESHCRERPVCRSVPERTELFPKIPDTSPILSFRPQR